MAVCARGSVLVFYAVFAGVFSTFWESKIKYKKLVGQFFRVGGG